MEDRKPEVQPLRPFVLQKNCSFCQHQVQVPEGLALEVIRRRFCFAMSRQVVVIPRKNRAEAWCVAEMNCELELPHGIGCSNLADNVSRHDVEENKQ